MVKVKNILYGYIILVAVGFMALATYNAIKKFTEPQNPINIKSIKLSTVTYQPGEPLQVEVTGSLTQEHCNVYVERTVVDATTGKPVWREITPIFRDVPRQSNPVLLSVNIAPLPIGQYYYQGTVHAICGVESYTKASPLLLFSVQKNRTISH